MNLLNIQKAAEAQGVSVPLIKWYLKHPTKLLKSYKARGGRVMIDGDFYELHGELKRSRVIILESDLKAWQKELLS
jgi:hypothetical protein